MNKIKKIHMMGIGGSGMSAVAGIAEKMGYDVTGCDIESSTAYTKHIFKGHSPDHLKGVELLVVSPAIYYQAKDNSELIEGQKCGIVMTWQEFLGKVLLKDKKVIAIAGTHGKSTTTAMAGKLLIDAGLDPTVLVGATVPEWGGNFRFGKGKWAVIEADEFNDNFLNYEPYIEIINNIEYDHPDYFKNEKEVAASFAKFIEKLNPKGVLYLNWNDKGIQRLLLDKADPKVIGSFQKTKKFNLKILGIHNQANAFMVYKLGRHLMIPEEQIIDSIESFEGISRRMELISGELSIKVYDDYAHHPTAIKTTLEGVREKYPKAKILVIDEPHGYKRTKALLPEYKGIFDSADKVIIGPIFPARDEIDESVSPQKVAKASSHKNIEAFNSFDELFRDLKLEIRNSNYGVIVIMGAGKSYLWAREIVKTLRGVKGLHTFKELTTFRVGGKIENYFEVETKEEIDKALDFAKDNNLPVFILGGGSDILASDDDFDGVVIKYTKKGFEVKGNELTGYAGANWDDLVGTSIENGLQGLECLSGIPGTVGAAPIQNIGAYGSEVKDCLKSLIAYDLKKRKFVRFDKDECKFGYRESIFKTEGYWQKYLITEATFSLNKNGKSKVNYDSLKGVIPENATLKEVRESVIKVRWSKLENPVEHGNAGSFFKNPVIDLEKKNDLIKNFPDVKVFPFEEGYKVSAAWLIEKAGLKGKENGGAAVSPKHSLIIINKNGKASANDVYNLSEFVVSEIDKKFGIKLEREVQLINF